MTDFTLYDGGSLFLLTPKSEEATAWVEKHLPDDAPTLGRGVAVEHRFIEDIVEGLMSEGLTIRSTET